MLQLILARTIRLILKQILTQKKDKAMKKLRLHDFHKSELDKQQQNALRGGACGCVCVGYLCACKCDVQGGTESSMRLTDTNTKNAPTDDSADTNGKERNAAKG